MNIPENVLFTFNTFFPAIDPENVSWSWPLPGKICRATFVEEEDIRTAEITLTGHYLCTGKTVEPDEVPAAVQAAIGHYSNDYALNSIEEISFSDGTLLYEASFRYPGLVEAGEGDEEFFFHDEERDEDANDAEDESITEEEPGWQEEGDSFSLLFLADGSLLEEEETEEEDADYTDTSL